MKYVYEMNALRVFSKMERIPMADMAQRVGVNAITMGRYVSGKRLPDIEMLVHICNVLRLSVSNFIHHPDLDIVNLTVFLPEEFKPVKFTGRKMELYRQENKMDKNRLIELINERTGIKTSIATYNKLIEGESHSHEVVIAFLNAFNLELNYLFDDKQIGMQETAIENELVSIPRKTLVELKDRLKKTEDENRRLYTENKRLKTREHARFYVHNDPRKQADHEMMKFIKKAQRALDDLKSFVPEEYEINEIKPYKNEETEQMIAAEENNDK